MLICLCILIARKSTEYKVKSYGYKLELLQGADLFVSLPVHVLRLFSLFLCCFVFVVALLLSYVILFFCLFCMQLEYFFVSSGSSALGAGYCMQEILWQLKTENDYYCSEYF